MYGRGNQVRVQTVSDALSAISKTIELAGEQSPLYRADNRYTLTIERLVEGFRREDPRSTPQLAVPITVPNHAFTTGMKSKCTKKQAEGCLSLIAFYYLLRVGEYTKPKTVKRNGVTTRATRTHPFTLANIGFFKNGKVVPRTSSLKILLSCDAATLKLDNQKNGRMGGTIHQEAVKKACCPIKALAHRVHHILSNGGDDTTLLCTY